jgi:hypothetical protein
MRVPAQLVVALLLLAATAASIHRVVEMRNQATAGEGVFRLDDSRHEESEALDRLLGRLVMMQQQAFAERLSRLRAEGALWIAPKLGAGRWAVFVDSASLVRRVYVRGPALLEPRTQLYADGEASVPRAQQDAFAELSLAGALYHELEHYRGVLDERAAYDAEIAWYETLRVSRWYSGLEEGRKRIYAWALESAILSAREARRRATGGGT